MLSKIVFDIRPNVVLNTLLKVKWNRHIERQIAFHSFEL